MIDENYDKQNSIDDVIDDTSDEEIPIEYSITSYGADYVVETIVKRLREDIIFVPKFQRAYVWSHVEASRFIESLLLGLPVPGVFLSKESETEKMLIIDGQQRLKTLQFFYDGVIKGHVFKLKGVQPKYEGKTYKTLAKEDRTRLDDAIIHATIVRQEKPTEDNSSIYHIFERLNTGGELLQPQEIRACIYHGPFNEFLSDLRNNKNWKEIYGPTSARLKDAELILRFFALYYWGKQYKSPMKNFLNKYMVANRAFKIQNAKTLSEKFNPTIKMIAEALGKRAFRPERALNAAVYDSVMIGLARRLDKGAVKNISQILDIYSKLLKDNDYLAACQTGTSQENKVETRISKASSYFNSIK